MASYDTPENRRSRCVCITIDCSINRPREAVPAVYLLRTYETYMCTGNWDDIVTAVDVSKPVEFITYGWGTLTAAVYETRGQVLQSERAHAPGSSNSASCCCKDGSVGLDWLHDMCLIRESVWAQALFLRFLRGGPAKVLTQPLLGCAALNFTYILRWSYLDAIFRHGVLSSTYNYEAVFWGLYP